MEMPQLYHSIFGNSKITELTLKFTGKYLQEWKTNTVKKMDINYATQKK